MAANGERKGSALPPHAFEEGGGEILLMIFFFTLGRYFVNT